MATAKRWFTLIEFLILAVVAMIIASVLVPAFSMSEDQARSSTCTGNLKQLAAAALAYSHDYDGQLPVPVSAGIGWDSAIEPFLKNTSVYLCPSDSRGPLSYGANSGTSDQGSPWGRKLAVNPSSTTILIGEYFGRMAGSGPAIAWPATGTFDAHDAGKGSNYAFCDGRVEFCRPDASALKGPGRGR